ncbi:MAG TPA: hypothetical protein VKV77_13330 [Methylovirgula sp.]|nr:hypothetical protein [Methylovirgula sp.]
MLYIDHCFRAFVVGLFLLVAALPALGAPSHVSPAESGPALAQTGAPGLEYRDPSQAPPAWGQFAKLVKYRFETWISANEAVANRFRAYLTDHAGKENGPPQTLIVRAWLNPDGTVERVSFPTLNDAQADKDLHTILMRGNIGEAPPPEMLQPLNLRFTLNIKSKKK